MNMAVFFGVIAFIVIVSVFSFLLMFVFEDHPLPLRIGAGIFAVLLLATLLSVAAHAANERDVRDCKQWAHELGNDPSAC